VTAAAAAERRTLRPRHERGDLYLFSTCTASAWAKDQHSELMGRCIHINQVGIGNPWQRAVWGFD